MQRVWDIRWRVRSRRGQSRDRPVLVVLAASVLLICVLGLVYMGLFARQARRD